MKIIGKALIIFTLAFVAASCTKPKEAPDPGSNSSNTGNNTGGNNNGGNTGGNSNTVHFTCKVDGVAYEATTFDGKIFQGSLSLNTFPQGAWSYPNVGISAPEGVAPGTYGQGQGVNVIYMESADPNGMWNLMTNGSVVINTHNVNAKEIKGTFSCTVKNFLAGTSKEITEGSFFVKYQ